MQSGNSIANTRWTAIVKLLSSRYDLAKLSYYKRNPLERRALDLVKRIYDEEGGSIFSLFLRGQHPVLFSPGELLNVWQQARLMAGHGGAFAEVGVFRGTSARCICDAKGVAPLHLFDTFSGLPELGPFDRRFKKGMFAADERIVLSRLTRFASIHCYKGVFPQSAAPIRNLRFSFVHLDVDLYTSTRDALAFFYPRMLPGGRILAHDYGQCEGVWRAFDEFIVDKPEKLEPMAETQVLLIKQ